MAINFYNSYFDLDYGKSYSWELGKLMLISDLAKEQGLKAPQNVVAGVAGFVIPVLWLGKGLPQKKPKLYRKGISIWQGSLRSVADCEHGIISHSEASFSTLNRIPANRAFRFQPNHSRKYGLS